jgi:hypothetical protein
MNRRLPWLVAAALLLLAGAAGAQVPDHMKCYKIKDPLKLKGVADLEGPQFGLERGCKLGPAKFFCVPVEKRVQQAIDASTGLPITLLPITNGPQPGDEICYAIRCPQPFPADQDVTDQFGRRTVAKLIPSLLCVPAVKGGPPPMLPCPQTAPQCNGPCPDANQKCTAIPGTTAQCQCVSLLDCGQTFPQCNGACPAAAPQCVPVTDPLGGPTPFCRCK